MAKSVEKSQPEATQTEAQVSAPAKVKCGIVMPISFCDGCDEKHWSDVKSIITQAVESSGPFTAELVSNADEVSLIHKTIVQNLYDNPIVICDVSGKNANVMFELGLRLAFDKPTIIIKDDKTDYSFDTSVIEHIPYPCDLRYSKIVDFTNKLSLKVRSTHERAKSDPEFSTFLKHLGTFVVASPETRVGNANDLIFDAIAELQRTVLRESNNRNQEPRIETDVDSLFKAWLAREPLRTQQLPFTELCDRYIQAFPDTLKGFTRNKLEVAIARALMSQEPV